MQRYYVAWTYGGRGTVTVGHYVIRALSWASAYWHWHEWLGLDQKIIDEHQLHVIPPLALFEVPERMAEWRDDTILEYYGKTDFENQWVTPQE